MWNFLSNAMGKFVQTGAEFIQNRLFIQQLLSMTEADALCALQAKVQSLDERAYQMFNGSIVMMMQESQNYIQTLQSSNSGGSWGNSYEDQLYSAVASFNEGPRGPSQEQMMAMQQAQMYLQSLQAIAMYADQFRSQSGPTAPTASPGASAATPASQSPQANRPPNSTQLKQRLIEMINQDADEAEQFQMLQEIYQAEIREGNISPERKMQLDAALGKLGDTLDDKSDELDDLMSQAAGLRELAADITPAVANPSLPKSAAPSAGTRITRTVEILGVLKTQLMNEGTQKPLAPQEQKAWEQLFAGTVNIQSALANVGSDTEAYKLEHEVLRPLALQAQDFFLRKHLLLTNPYFPTQSVTPDPNAVFYSGEPDLRQVITSLCKTKQLSIQPESAAENPAQQRWNQLRASAIAVFDLRKYDPAITYSKDQETASQIAAVTYELGIAFALGKPVVIIVKAGQKLPFDVDIASMELNGNASDLELLGNAMDSALYGRQRGGEKGSISQTVAFLHRQYGTSTNNYLRTALTVLNAETEADPVKARQVIKQMLRFLGDEAPCMVFPAWPGDYPQNKDRFCFHVTAFESPTRLWPAKTKEFIQALCPPSIAYKRGDQSQERDIIRAIWHDICHACCLVVDITDLNPNAVLELGMAHVLGRDVFLITQDADMGNYPATIAKERKFVYSLEDDLHKKQFGDALNAFYANIQA